MEKRQTFSVPVIAQRPSVGCIDKISFKVWMPSFKKEIKVKEGQIIFRIWIVPRQKAEEQHRRWEFFLFSLNFCFTPLQSIWTPTLGKRHLNSHTGS